VVAQLGVGLGHEWGETTLEAAKLIKSWIGQVTEIGLLLLALGIVAALLVGGQLPFFGSIVGNIIGLVKELGANGLAGLIALGIILWLFSNRNVS